MDTLRKGAAMAEKPKKDRNMSFRASTALWEWLHREAEKADRSVAWVINDRLQEMIDATSKAGKGKS